MMTSDKRKSVADHEKEVGAIVDSPEGVGRKENRWSLVVIVVAVVILYSFNLTGWLINDDEGTALYSAWRLSAGEVPYDEFLTTQAPLFLALGGGLVKVFGRSILVLRISAVVATLAAGWIVYRIGSRTWTRRAGLLGLLFFLLNGTVHAEGRVFRADTFMLLLVVAGLWALSTFQDQQRRRWLVLAGFFWGLATLIKILGVMPMVGAGLFFLAQLWRNRSRWWQIGLDLLALCLPYAGILLLGFGLPHFFMPNLLTNVLGSQKTLGAGEPLFMVMFKGLWFLAMYLRNNWVFVFVVPVIIHLMRRRDAPGAIFAWQAAAVLVFLVMRGALFPRYMLYLIPSLALLMGYLTDQVFQWFAKTRKQSSSTSRVARQQSVTYPALLQQGWKSILPSAVVLLALSPWLILVGRQTVAREDGTRALATYIAEQTAESSYVLSDYAALNFHAGRRSVPRGAVVSWGWAASGALTGAMLIEEMEATDVRMVVLHVGLTDSPDRPGVTCSPDHLSSLHDYQAFYSHLQDHFDMVRTFERDCQLFEIFLSHPEP
jgi:4-amino-4-deoxy-L-arabinose transferase-like glycosyltransferase